MMNRSAEPECPDPGQGILAIRKVAIVAIRERVIGDPGHELPGGQSWASRNVRW